MILKRDDAFRAVCEFRTEVNPGTFSVGTGMFVSSQADENNIYGWIITAGHVAVGTADNTEIVIATKDGKAEVLPLNMFGPITNWKHHPVADVSAFQIIFSDTNKKFMENRFFPYDHINTTRNVVSRDFELTSIGFPRGLGTEGSFSPFTFRSYASSGFVTLPRADTGNLSDFFCLENPSVGGYSGCPVFDLGYSTNELEEQKAEFDRILNSNEYSISKIYQNEQEIRTIATMLNIPEAEIETLITVNGSTQLGDLDKLGVHEAGIEEVKETAEDLGIVAQDVQNYTTVDNKGEVKLDANKLDSKGIQSNEISGNDKITTFYSMNNILGQNYASYRIIKSVSGTSFILGINEDGTTERIEDNSLQIDSTKSMSLMREDGSLKNVGVVISFSIKDPGSKYNGKELVGLYNDNGNIGAYYGRKELDGAILGKSVEQGRIINQGNEARQKSMLDTKTNSDISGEASSAYDRTADGCNSNVYYVASVPDKDKDELIEECSKHFGIDEDDLRDAVEEKTRDEHDENKTDEKIVEEAAVELSKESDDLEDPDDPSNDDEPEHVHGTPWGNPNTLY